METNDKHSDEWLDWLEDADTAGDVGRPADEKELERLRQHESRQQYFRSKAALARATARLHGSSRRK